MSPCVSAPGKLMLAGEYVVLDGAPSLVAAVDRRARVCWAPGLDGSRLVGRNSAETNALPPEALLTRSLAERRFGPVPDPMTLDVSELRSGDRKIGLGSSAAGAAAAAAAVMDRAGQDITDEDVRRQALDLALEGHRSVAPQGSGADVAASVLGGVVRFRKVDDATVDARTVSWPDGLHARVVWTGVEARTSELVARVRALQKRNPDAYRDRMGALRDAAERFVEGFAGGDAPAVVDAADAHHRAMADLGTAAEAPIVETRLARVAELARRAGGAAKPSGAGGGDVAIALFPPDASPDSFEGWCRAAGMTLVSLHLGAEGITPDLNH